MPRVKRKEHARRANFERSLARFLRGEQRLLGAVHHLAIRIGEREAIVIDYQGHGRFIARLR